MKNRILNSTLVAIIALLSANQIHAQCRATDDQTARVLEYVKGVASMNVPARDSLGLTGVDTAQVASVSDSTTCARVAQVVDSVFAKTPATIYIVVRAGPRYVLRHADLPGSTPNELLHFVDTTFVYRRTTRF
jgi:hypothetical protein